MGEWNASANEVEIILTTTGGDKGQEFPVPMSKHGFCRMSKILESLAGGGKLPKSITEAEEGQQKVACSGIPPYKGRRCSKN